MIRSMAFHKIPVISHTDPYRPPFPISNPISLVASQMEPISSAGRGVFDAYMEYIYLGVITHRTSCDVNMNIYLLSILKSLLKAIHKRNEYNQKAPLIFSYHVHGI